MNVLDEKSIKKNIVTVMDGQKITKVIATVTVGADVHTATFKAHAKQSPQWSAQMWVRDVIKYYREVGESTARRREIEYQARLQMEENQRNLRALSASKKAQEVRKGLERALAFYGKGNAGYYDGYENVYGEHFGWLI